MTSSSPSEPTPPTSLLGNRNFVLLWCAYAVSAMGDHLSEMAILKTQHAVNSDVDVTPLTARMTFMFFVPFFLLGPFAGLLADRLPRRGIMITADAIRCAVMLGFVGLLGWMQDWGRWGPFLPLLLIGLFAALFSPARSALLPTLIRRNQLARANALISGLGIIATMISVAISGYLADRYEPVIAFRLDAVTYLLSAIFLIFLVPPRSHPIPSTRSTVPMSVGSIADGLRYVRCHLGVRELLAIAAFVWFCGPLVNSVIPAIVRDVYGGTYTQMGAFRAFLGIGFVIGAIAMAAFAHALRSEMAITGGLFGISAGIAVFALSVFLPFEPATLYVVGAVGVVMAGMSAVTVMASFNTLLQRTVADRFRGRVFGVKDLCCTGALLAATGSLGIPAWRDVDRWVGFILVGVSLAAFVAAFTTLTVRLRRAGRRTGYRPGFLFWGSVNELLAKLWWRMERVGPKRLPGVGPVIVTANHTCAADPFFLGAAASHRPIGFMVAAEYCKLRVVKYMLGLTECISVQRDGRDTAATKQAIRHLRAGKVLGIFMEGRIMDPGEPIDLKDGVAMLALRTGATVIPAHISGVKEHSGIVRDLLARHRARVRFGPPVDLTNLEHAGNGRDRVKVATERIYAAIMALAPVDTSTIPHDRSNNMPEPHP